MKKIIIFLALLVSISKAQTTEFSVYEANYPNVKDYNVNIDETTLVVNPLGSYVEFNIYMTVSYDFDSWYFKNYNELEFIWKFNLPQDAIVHQFWYWVGDSIMAATVLDKWTAELLFNNVSSPVRNPGLLTQSLPNGNGQVAYDLRLYPIQRNEKKRFKIQYLVPCRPTGANMRVWLPMTQLISDKTTPSKFLKVLYKYGATSYEPKIIGANPIQSFDNKSLEAWEQDIPIEKDQFVEMELPSPIKKDAFLSTFTKNGENFYQLAVNPPSIPRTATPRNVLFVIDFNRFNTNSLDGDFLLSYLKESILQSFSASDSINVLAAYDTYILGSDKWVGCTKDEIDNLFEKVMMRSFPSYNSLIPLVSKAADFINSRQNKSEVLFLTNTNTINLYGSSKDQLADQIVQQFKSGTIINFMDLDDKSGLVYDNGFYDTQMQSFYGRITSATSGDLFFLKYNTIKEMLYSFVYEQISHYESIEVQLKFTNGYANSKHFIAMNEGYYPMNTPILQLGKYAGSFPVDITVFGKYRTVSQNYTITINENQVEKGNDQLATAWYGGEIQSLVSLPYDPLTITDIISMSISQSILTPYSGFLIFNKDQNHGYCLTCTDETKTSVLAEKVDSTSNVEVSVYPNPFNPTTTIKYNLPERGRVVLRIYNMLGQQMADLVNADIEAGNHSISFNGSKLSSGIYVLNLKVNGSKKNYFISKKLILMK